MQNGNKARAPKRKTLRQQLASWGTPSKPAVQPQPKPKAKAKPNKPRQNRGDRDVFNPLNSALIRSISSQGDAYPVSGLARADIVTQEAGRTLLIVTNTGVSGTLAAQIYVTTPSASRYTIPTLASAASAGGPTSGRAMKAGVTIVNVTKRLDVGGRIYVLNANQRFSLPAAPSAMSAANWSSLADEIIAHPHTRAYTGGDFITPKTFVCHPVSDPDYTAFTPWTGTELLDPFCAHWAIWSGTTALRRPMSTIAIVIDTFPDASVNDYSFSMRGSYYTRWPLASVPGQNQKPIPTGPAGSINKEIEDASRNAPHPRDLPNFGQRGGGVI